jgi:hypothetical protein
MKTKNLLLILQRSRSRIALPTFVRLFSGKIMERRAAFDIGSGSTKIQVSDIQNGAIVQTLFSEERPVAFGLALVQSSNENLSHEIQMKGLQTLTELKQIAQSHGASKFAAVATEVFRKAKNGNEYLDKVRSMGISVTLVTQDIEAELGFWTVVAVSGEDPSNQCVWDSGGASFQITSLDSSSERPMLRKYMGALGTSISAGILLKDIRGATAPDFATINPVSPEEAQRLVAAILARLPEVPPWLHGRDTISASAGINSLFKLCADILAHNRAAAAAPAPAGPPAAAEFTLSEAESALAACVGVGDEGLRRYQSFAHAEGPHVAVPKLALLVAVLRRTAAARVRCVPCVGSCPGLLVSPAYW